MSPTSIWEKFDELHESWHEPTGVARSQTHILRFLHSVITTWQVCEIFKWKPRIINWARKKREGASLLEKENNFMDNFFLLEGNAILDC